MKIDPLLCLVAVAITYLFLMTSLACIAKSHEGKNMSVPMILAILAVITAFLPVAILMRINAVYGQSTTLRPTSMSNGIYQVLGTYRNTDGTWLANLQEVRIINVTTNDGKWVEFVKGSNQPVVVAIDEPISSPQYKSGTNPFTGLASITNGTLKDYNPFLHPFPGGTQTKTATIR